MVVIKRPVQRVNVPVMVLAKAIIIYLQLLRNNFNYNEVEKSQWLKLWCFYCFKADFRIGNCILDVLKTADK